MPSPVASVNGQLITRFELEATVQEYVLQLRQQDAERLSEAEKRDLERVALEKLIVWELIFQGDEQQRLEVAEAQVAEETDKLVGEFPDRQDFYDRLNGRGVDVEVFRHSVRRELTVEAMMARMVAKSSEPEVEEVAAEYQKYLTENEDEKPLSLEEATPQIRSFLQEQAGMARLREWVAQLRSQAAIEITQSNVSSQSRIGI